MTNRDMPMLTATDPRTGLVRLEYPAAREQEVADTVAATRAAQRIWAALTPAERSRRLLRLADRVEERRQGYADALRAGTGKPQDEALAEVDGSADVLRFYAGAARTDSSPAAGRRMNGRESWVRWEPLGVIAAIVPWNYPMMMAAWRLGPALAAGNAVVLKPAETTPDTALLLRADAGELLGEHVLSVLPGDRETGQLLVGSQVDAIAFTGSTTGGLDVAYRADLRPVSLELGGNCPALVLPDAPQHTYASLAAASVFNAGQSCAAPARVITLPENYAATVAGLAAAMGVLTAGIDFGPLNNPDQVARYDRILAATGAAVRHTGQVKPGPGEDGGYWRPSVVLADLPDDDEAVVTEVFGPVLTVQQARNVEHAVELANSMPHALAGSVWSADVGRALRLAGELDAGEAWVNCHLDQTPELPHGGRKGSGHGTDLSTLALAEYQRPKCVTVRLD
ncbi:aldehyde dehydrogenase family protein [Streptomyces echinoruber]|uniref:Gamma-aminobutyraldehyde dehydrogenase n=1 Tax=Streptomyces echinoruber TaxID=68898 RepID=A0A918QUD5_9ACTN|nr:aldehyde dehydrogenase family protein [Streptomyces echinoruber]GGZ70873.1 gamma-aminobutyraldehyde dehydrogenase [Streptomyces echinoruber]